MSESGLKFHAKGTEAKLKLATAEIEKIIDKGMHDPYKGYGFFSKKCLFKKVLLKKPSIFQQEQAAYGILAEKIWQKGPEMDCSRAGITSKYHCFSKKTEIRKLLLKKPVLVPKSPRPFRVRFSYG